MNILFLNSIDESTYGGMEEWIRLVAIGLRAHGHTVTVAGRKRSLFLERLGRTSPEIPLLPLNISGDFNPATILSIKKFVEREQVDIVVPNFNKDVRLGGLAARWSGQAQVVWSVAVDLTRDSALHWLLTAKLVDSVIVPSQSLKHRITRLGYIPDEIVEVIPIGIPDTNHRAADPESRPRLRAKYSFPPKCTVAITVGRLVDEKGHRYLMDAIPELIREFPTLYFLWLGSGPLEAELREKARQLGIESRVLFAGTQETVAEDLAGADLMIHPSTQDTFPIAILEGMRAGLPILATRVGGIPEELGEEYEYLIASGEGAAIVTAAKQLLKRPDIARVGAVGRERWAKMFRLEEMQDRVEAYLSRILRTEPHHG